MNLRRGTITVALLAAWIFISRFPCDATDVDNFVDALNVEWTSTNYSACLSNINTRLSTNTNDLPALIAKVGYLLYVDANCEGATNIFIQTDPLVSSLCASNVLQAYGDFREAVTSSVEVVPMTNTPTAEQMQNTRNFLYPTNYPEQRLLRLLGNP